MSRGEVRRREEGGGGGGGEKGDLHLYSNKLRRFTLAYQLDRGST